MPDDRTLNLAAAKLDRVLRNLRGAGSAHAAGLESLPTLRGAINLALIEVEIVREMLRDEPTDQSKLF